MAVIFRGTKQCALCKYWDGERVLNPAKTEVRCAQTSVFGICGNKATGTSYGKRTKADYGSCNKFERIPQIR